MVIWLCKFNKFEFFRGGVYHKIPFGSFFSEKKLKIFLNRAKINDIALIILYLETKIWACTVLIRPCLLTISENIWKKNVSCKEFPKILRCDYFIFWGKSRYLIETGTLFWKSELYIRYTYIFLNTSLPILIFFF